MFISELMYFPRKIHPFCSMSYVQTSLSFNKPPKKPAYCRYDGHNEDMRKVGGYRYAIKNHNQLFLSVIFYFSLTEKFVFCQEEFSYNAETQKTLTKVRGKL